MVDEVLDRAAVELVAGQVGKAESGAGVFVGEDVESEHAFVELDGAACVLAAAAGERLSALGFVKD